MFDLIETSRQGRVAIIRLNRTKQLNALNKALMDDVAAAARTFDADDSCGCIVITGNGRAFAAGADIAEMNAASAETLRSERWFNEPWTALNSIKKPVLAAVNGFALGGGCELALMCDVIVASDQAKFGQPEVRIGILPGMGGSQRLARYIGKPMTMDLCLTGRLIDAHEALRMGLVSRVFEHDAFEHAYMGVADEIASKSLVATRSITKAVDEAYDLSLDASLENERQTFYSTFDSQDRSEGMTAFLEKRDPEWKHR